LQEPISHAPTKRQRASQVDPFRPQMVLPLSVVDNSAMFV
jgi:hypothetical protein